MFKFCTAAICLVLLNVLAQQCTSFPYNVNENTDEDSKGKFHSEFDNQIICGNK